uniref:Leydig cell tumor 10 kDa protein homolog n=1 Tax=Steinernema glaseri TaxID=37863 RepID=A0A1I7Y5X1_9BILA
MAQHNMKKKTTLPKGVKNKAKKAPKKTGPKRGQNLYIAPKKAVTIEQSRISAEVSKVINKKNEEMIKNIANDSVGRNDAEKK